VHRSDITWEIANQCAIERARERTANVVAATVEKINPWLLGWYSLISNFRPDRCKFPTVNHLHTLVASPTCK